MFEEERYRAINPARRRRLSGFAAAKTIADLQLLARRRLPGFLSEYIEGGADAEVTLRRNCAVFEDFRWTPKMDRADTGPVAGAAGHQGHTEGR